MKEQLNQEKILQFKEHLRGEERSASTIQKYLHDLRLFFAFMDGKELTKATVLE